MVDGFCCLLDSIKDLGRGLHHNKKNDASSDESLSVTFIVQYVNRNLQVDLNTQILVHTNVLKSTLGSLLF